MAVQQNKTTKNKRTESVTPVSLEFVDFGCGNGRSLEFASSVVAGPGFGLDISDDAVAACRAKGFAAERGNLLDFEQRNVAAAAFAINVVQELPGRTAFERGLTNMIQAARNFVLVQHTYFDADPKLALAGRKIEANFHKKIQYKPMVADYISFVERYKDALRISGIGIFGSGQADVSPMALNSTLFGVEADEETPVYRSLRVIFGRKDAARFRAALEKTGAGTALFVWERA